MFVTETVITCVNTDCGISFAVPSWWAKGKRETHAYFYCPNGHSQHFTGETAEEKLRRENARLIQRQAMLLDEKAAAERKAKRLERRAAGGTCPCCKRTFANMSRHMKHKHPEFVSENIVHLKQGKSVGSKR